MQLFAFGILLQNLKNDVSVCLLYYARRDQVMTQIFAIEIDGIKSVRKLCHQQISLMRTKNPLILRGGGLATEVK